MNEPDETLLIRCRNLVKEYRSEAENLQVLRGLDLDLFRGTSCAIMGASGSGKSTLLSILGGMERFDSGTIDAGPFKLHELAESELPSYRERFVGFVFQFHHLLKDFTTLENIALPAYMGGLQRKEAWKKAAELLEKVGLSARAGHFPLELSGGERQRAAIARALVNSPKLLLADEPTGNLDSENAKTVRTLLFELPAMTGATVLVATHDSRIAEEAEFRYLLEGGTLQAV